MDKVKIAPGITIAHWKALDLDPDRPESKDWNTAVSIFDARIRSRFFQPVDKLLRVELLQKTKTFGFVVLAIDFLIIETLQGFREGLLNHTGLSGRLLNSFLTNWDVFINCVPTERKAVDCATDIYKHYRCALYHSGATDGAFRVGVSGPVFEFNSISDVKINRDKFHVELKRYFDDYLVELQQPSSHALRRKFKTKMDGICGL